MTDPQHICLFKAEKKNDAYPPLLKAEGYTVSFEPVLDFDYVNREALLAALLGTNDHPCAGIIATSARALISIKLLMQDLDESTRNQILQSWKDKSLFVVGDSTLAELPFPFKHIFSVNSDAKQLAIFIKEKFSNILAGTPQKMLFLCSNIRNDELPSILNPQDCPTIIIQELVVYTTTKLEIKPNRINKPQWWVFFSPSGVDAVFESIHYSSEDKFFDIKIACIGKTTANSMEKYGIKPQAIAAKPTPADLLIAIKSHS